MTGPVLDLNTLRSVHSQKAFNWAGLPLGPPHTELGWRQTSYMARTSDLFDLLQRYHGVRTNFIELCIWVLLGSKESASIVFLSLLSFMIATGQEAADKPFSLVATNPHPLRLVVLKEDLLMIFNAIR